MEVNDDDLPVVVDLPTQPLASEGPALQHLGKTRPKPARMQRGKGRATIKPTILKEDTETPAPIEEKPTEVVSILKAHPTCT